MIHVETIEFAVADEINPGFLLRRNNHARGVGQRLLGGKRNEPIRYGVGSDSGGLNARWGM